MKKIISLVLALVMILSVCSFAVADEKVTINIYRDMFNTIPDAKAVDAVTDAINAYLAEKGANFTVTQTVINSGEYGDKANLALAASETNLLWTASWMGTVGTNDLVPLQAVYDITDLLPGSALYASMDAGQWEASKYNGRNYFIPVYKDNVEGYGIAYRDDLAAKYNWDFSNVTKLADIEPMLEDAYNEGILYPYLTQKTALFYRWNIDSFDFFTADADTNFFAVDRATNTVVDTLQTAEYVEFCKLMKDWAEKGYLSEDDATKVTTDMTTHTQDWAFTYWTITPKDELHGENSRFTQDCTVLPTTKRWAHSTSNLGSCYCVTATSTPAQAQACVDFMGMLYTDPKLADIFTYGAEGTMFTYDENGQVVKAKDIGWDMDMWSNVSATVLTPTSSEPSNMAQLYLDFNGGAEASCAAGFRFNKEPVEAEYAACRALFGEYGFALEHGAVEDVEAAIAEYQAALDAAGYQKCLAEFSAQYEAWKAAK